LVLLQIEHIAIGIASLQVICHFFSIWLLMAMSFISRTARDKYPNFSFPHYWLITQFVTRLTRPVPLVKQEPPVLVGFMLLDLLIKDIAMSNQMDISFMWKRTMPNEFQISSTPVEKFMRELGYNRAIAPQI
jgi:hypothetical protein